MIKKQFHLLIVLIIFLLSCSDQSNLELNNSYLFDQAKVFSGFELETNNGIFNMQNLEEKLTLIYFGYTSCPDVCPLEMSQLGAAFQQLSDAEKEKVQGLFITVDPSRDSLQIVSNYASYFDESFIGARIANPAKLFNLTSQLGSYYQIVSEKGIDVDNQSYLVDHTSSFTIIDPNGLYAGLSPTPHNVSDLVSDIRSLINHYF